MLQLSQNIGYSITLAPQYTCIASLNLIWLIINCPYLCTPYINRDTLITSHLINILILFLLIMIKLTWLHHICKNGGNLFSVPIYVQYINRDSVNIFGTTRQKVTRKKSGTPYINYRWSEVVSQQFYNISVIYKVLNSYVECKLKVLICRNRLGCT